MCGVVRDGTSAQRWRTQTGSVECVQSAMASRRVVPILIACAVLLAACSGTKGAESGSEDFVPGDVSVLREAVERTAAEPYRYHTTLSIEGGDDSVLGTVGDLVEAIGMTKLLDITGTIVGEDRALRVKTSLIAGYLDGLDLNIPVDPIGLQTEARRIDGVWYVRAPRTLITAGLQELGARLPADNDTLDKISSGWVRLDARASHDSMESFSRTALLGSEQLQRVLDPVDLLIEVGSATEMTMADGTFDGEDVTVVRATIGVERDELGTVIDDGGGTATTTTIDELPSDNVLGNNMPDNKVPVRIEVAIGRDGYIRSISYGVAFRDLAGLVVPSLRVDAGDSSEGDAFAELRQSIRTNFLDVGETELRIEPPKVFSVVTLGDNDDEQDDGEPVVGVSGDGEASGSAIR